MVKTRLVPALGENRACDLQIALLNDLFYRLNGNIDGEIWGTEPAQLPHYKELISSYGLGYKRQMEGDLGVRMEAAVASALLRGKVPILLGADCPLMNTGVVERIIEEIEGGAEAVMVPALDGGYVALGLTTRHYSLFRGIEWGTDSVAGETLAAIRRAGLICSVLDPLFDIDTEADLACLRSFAGKPGHAALTAWIES